MRAWFGQLDDLLRGKKTGPDLLTSGGLQLPLRSFVPFAVMLGAIYGFFMGWFAVLQPEAREYRQLLATAVKLPALFLLTLIVTFPSLYVFNALVGCRLSFAATLRLLVGAIVVNLAVAASFGPILGFFTVSTTNYSFMVMLNVVLLAIAGCVGLAFLLQTLRRVSASLTPPPAPAPPMPPAPPDEGAPASALTEPLPPPSPRDPGPLDHATEYYPCDAIGSANGIFRIWVIIYGLVGAQMGWLLRPFIGSPDLPFSWFRAREGNFFLSIVTHLSNLVGTVD